MHPPSTVNHYIDRNGREADAVIELFDGRYGLFGIKVGYHQVEKAANKLVKLGDVMKENCARPPEFLCVVCGMCDSAFRHADRVYVVPVISLRDTELV